jgi:DNA mismatch endonuclease Vsr
VSYAAFTPSSTAASNMGRGNHSAGTAPEKTLRMALRRAGLRFRTNDKSIPGSPDVVLFKPRVAIFCDGDFWHGRQWNLRRKRLAKGSNARYWLAKIEQNIKRDRQVTRSLRELGWHVVRVWESDVVTGSDRIASRIAAIADTIR